MSKIYMTRFLKTMSIICAKTPIFHFEMQKDKRVGKKRLTFLLIFRSSPLNTVFIKPDISILITKMSDMTLHFEVILTLFSSEITVSSSLKLSGCL